MQTYASQKVTLDVNNDTTKEDDTNIDALKKTIENY